jgi:hypothetical protein
MAITHTCDIAERNYSLASSQLQLANARNQVKVLEIQCSTLQDGVETTRAEYEVLLSQLAEERCSSDGLKIELARLQRALWKTANALNVADSEIQRLSFQTETAERNTKQGAGNGIAVALELAEEKLVAAARRETSLQERLLMERAAKEIAEKGSLARGHASCVHVSENSPYPGKTAAFAPERKTESQFTKLFVENDSFQKEIAELNVENAGLRCTVAWYEGAMINLKEQLEAAEKRLCKIKPASNFTHASCALDLESHVDGLLRESDSTRAVLAVLRRQLEDRNAELIDERAKTSQMRTDISRMISDLCEAKSQFLEQFPTVLPYANNAMAQAKPDESDNLNRCTENPLNSDPSTYSKERPLQNQTVQETVVNVIDHLSLSGYVSPLRQTKNNNRTADLGCEPVSACGSRNVVVEGTSRQILEGVKNDTKGYLKENHKFDIVACRELSSGMGNNAQIPPRAHLRSSANAPRGAVKSARKKKRRKLLEQGAIPGSDTLPTSLLFGMGEDFQMEKSNL